MGIAIGASRLPAVRQPPPSGLAVYANISPSTNVWTLRPANRLHPRGYVFLLIDSSREDAVEHAVLFDETISVVSFFFFLVNLSADCIVPALYLLGAPYELAYQHPAANALRVFL